MAQAAKGVVGARVQHLQQAAALLESFSYQRVLERGFALVSDSSGSALSAAAEVKPGMGLEIQFHDAKVTAQASGKPDKPSRSFKKDDGKQGSLL